MKFDIDSLTFADVVKRAASIIARNRQTNARIDIYREVMLDDPVTLEALGRRHPVAVRVKITAQSMLFDSASKEKPPHEGGG